MIGVAIIVGGALGGWVLGLWGRGAEAELLKILDAELLVEERGARLFLTIKNEGNKDALVMKIVVEKVGEAKLEGVVFVPAGRLWRTPPEGLVIVPYNGVPIMSGEPYMVRVITDTGNVYQIIVRAQSP